MEEVAEELLCVGCGYDLRHARSDGACSECGVEVSKSIAGDQLYRADGTWLRFVRSGLSCILVGELALLSLVLIALIRFGASFVPRWQEWYALVVCVVFTTMQTVGGWWVMRPEKEERFWPVVARIASVVFGLCMMNEILAQIVRLTGSTFYWQGTFGDWMNFAWGGMCVQMIGVYLRGRQIARRSWSMSLRWQCELFCVVEVLFLGSTIAARRYAGRSPLGDIMEMAMMVLVLLLMSWGAVVVWMMRKRVAQAIGYRQRV